MTTIPKQIYISSPTQQLNFTDDNSITSQTTIIYGDEMNSSYTITLPHYQTVGNTMIYYLFNNQPIGGQNMIVKSPTLNNNQMYFLGKNDAIENAITLSIAPNHSEIVMIMNKNYTVMELSSQPIPVVELPTPAPTSAPTLAPTSAPTLAPTSAPTLAPTSAPYDESSSSNSQSYTIEGYITPDQIIAKPGLTIDNFVCESATFQGTASPNVTGDNLIITLYQQTTTSSSWLFYIWSNPWTKMMLVEFATTGNPYEIIVNNFYTAAIKSNVTGSSSAAINAWKSLSSTKRTGSYVTAGNGYIVNDLQIKINNPTSNVAIPAIPQLSSNNTSQTISTVSANSTINLSGVTVDNVVCLSATFGGSMAGTQSGNNLGIILYNIASTPESCSWLFYISDSPYTKMILVEFVPDGQNSIKVTSLAAGYVMYDATVSETALKNAWNSMKSVDTADGDYTVNNLKITTSSSESFESFFDSYPSTYSYFNESYYDDNIDRYQFI